MSRLPDSPIELPLRLSGRVVRGYGRGGKQLGFPTANIEEDALRDLDYEAEGVFYGWSLLDREGEQIEPMVMSIGWNPTFNNKNKTAEVHVLKKYDSDFYNENIRVIILGFVRPMTKFSSLDELIAAINNDIDVSRGRLVLPDAQAFKTDPFFKK